MYITIALTRLSSLRPDSCDFYTGTIDELAFPCYHIKWEYTVPMQLTPTTGQRKDGRFP